MVWVLTAVALVSFGIVVKKAFIDYFDAAIGM